jgi:acetate kinase
MSGAVAVLNSGSSSIKFSLHEAHDTSVRVRGQIEAIHTAPRFVAKDAAGRVLAEKTWSSGTPLGHEGALDHIVAYLRSTLEGAPLAAVGHRVVHGGLAYDGPVLVNRRVLAQLETLVPLAPLHQPHNLAPIRRLLERAPLVPQVACFDTAFHRTQPEVAQMFGLPRAYHDEGVRRFGFHGLSYEYIASQLPALDPHAARGRTIVLHLGNGASMCALLEGRSIATTMGFTAVDGLLMGTRCGALDPGVVLYLMEAHRLDARAIERLLYQHSGLLGVSGISSDMRTLLASSEPGARLAVDLYVYRICREMGALAAALGGLDALVFTGGVGENAASIRARVCRDAAWLGVELDADANAVNGTLISAGTSAVKAWRVATDEEGVIARHTQWLASRADAPERAHA